MASRIRKIAAQGQAIWLDYISRALLESGELRELMNEGVTGVTSNPSIFQQSIAKGSEYDAQIRELARAGLDKVAVYEALALRDIGQAADHLRPVYNETHGRDGYVSIEVSPELAHDADATIAEARRLYGVLERPNVMIKVPATEEGLPAIKTLIGDGINVNVTLIFSVSMYKRVMQAYLDGLRRLQAAGRPIGLVGSVASFFVSRVDTVVDKLLARRIEAGEKKLDTLRGQAAIANSKIAYARYQEVFESAQFADLRAAGARVQRPLWASTSVKNPAFPDTKYVDALIGPNTVNTVPPQTLAAIRDHANVARTIDLDVDDAFGVIERLHEQDLDIEDVAARLLTDGVQAFADSYATLLSDVEAKRAKYAGA